MMRLTRVISCDAMTSRSRTGAGQSGLASASCRCPLTDPSGVPTSCANCAASCPSAARRSLCERSSRARTSSSLRCSSASLHPIARPLRKTLRCKPLVEGSNRAIGFLQPIQHSVEGFRDSLHLGRSASVTRRSSAPSVTSLIARPSLASGRPRMRSASRTVKSSATSTAISAT